MKFKDNLAATPSKSSRANTPRWTQDLDDALTNNDDDSVWDVVSQQFDQEGAHDTLATMVSRLRYRVGGKTHFAEMFQVPIITEGAAQPDLSEQAVWKGANHAISEALDNWLPRGVKKNLFGGFFPVDITSSWKTEGVRAHLMRTVPGQWSENLKTTMSPIDLPPGAPRLWFMHFVLTSLDGWPTLPQYDQEQERRMQKIVSFAVTRNGQQAPTVLPPERVQHATTDGVGMWLYKLANQCGLKGWTTNFSTRTPDVVKISLVLDGEQLFLTQFVLRRHQIGAQGLNDVLQVLHSLAPMLDRAPIDPGGALRPEEAQRMH